MDQNATSPNIITLANNVIAAAKDVAITAVKTGVIKASDEKAASRMATCEMCEMFNKEASRCGKCGCYMKVKVTLEASKCPLNKW